MKRMLEIVLVLTMLLTLAGCGGASAVESGPQSVPAESVKAETESQLSDNSSERLPEFSRTAQIEETVLLDEDNVRVIATELTYESYAAELEVTIENNSDRDLSFISGSIGYSCNSVNGIMVEDGYLNCDVAAGKKAMDTIMLDYETMQLYGISEIAEIELGIYTTDDDFNDTYYTPRKVTTSADAGDEFDPLRYQQRITSEAAQNTFDYEVEFFAANRLYERDGVAVLSEALLRNKDGEYLLLVEVENQSEDLRVVSAGNITVNNMIAPGKRGIITVDLSSVAEERYWQLYGIEHISTIGIDLQQSDSEWDELTEYETVAIHIDDKSEIDPAGEEIYNQNGARIVKKAVLAPGSKYDTDYRIMLLAENTGEDVLDLSIAYDTLSVNGFMVDYFGSSWELQPGQFAMMEIKLYGDDLEEINVTSVDQITQVEFELEIEQNGSDAGSSTIIMDLEQE